MRDCDLLGGQYKCIPIHAQGRFVCSACCRPSGICPVVYVWPCVLPAQLCHCSATSETVRDCWWCRDCLLATWMNADKVRNTPRLWSLLSPIGMDVVFDFPWICTGVKMQKIAHCFRVPPAAVRKRRLRKCGVFFVCFLFCFFFLQWVFFFQHLKSGLQLLIKNELFQNQESLCTEKGAASSLFKCLRRLV